MAVAQPDEESAESPGVEPIEELFQALESPLLSYAWRLTGERESAEDVVQEAFMRLHAQFDKVNEPRRWLYRTVHNLALNQRRAGGKIVSLDAPQAASPAENGEAPPLPDEQIARWEGIGLLRLTLQTLEPATRELIRLKFEENLSYKEIAERTGLSTGNVGYQLHHALKALGDELSRNGVVP